MSIFSRPLRLWSAREVQAAYTEVKADQSGSDRAVLLLKKVRLFCGCTQVSLFEAFLTTYRTPGPKGTRLYIFKSSAVANLQADLALYGRGAREKKDSETDNDH